MDSQRLRQRAQDLHRSGPGPLCIYYGFQFSAFMEFLSVQMSGHMFPVLSLVLFSFCLFAMSKSDVSVFVLSYFILLYYYLLE